MHELLEPNVVVSAEFPREWKEDEEIFLRHSRRRNDFEN
jgi:hypothetical protein